MKRFVSVKISAYNLTNLVNSYIKFLTVIPLVYTYNLKAQPLESRHLGDPIKERQVEINEADRLGARSDRYSRIFDRALKALISGDSATFRSLLSSTTVLEESRGPGAIDAVISGVFIPFFEGFSALTEEISTAPTYDASGATGIAIGRSFKTVSGEEKRFVIYLIDDKRRVEQGGVVVGNLLINKTIVSVQGMSPELR
jgi:hypothetical protein